MPALTAQTARGLWGGNYGGKRNQGEKAQKHVRKHNNYNFKQQKENAEPLLLHLHSTSENIYTTQHSYLIKLFASTRMCVQKNVRCVCVNTHLVQQLLTCAKPLLLEEKCVIFKS